MGFVPAKMVWKPLEGAAGNVAERLKERFGAFGATLGNERELEEFFWRFFFVVVVVFASFFLKEFLVGFQKPPVKLDKTSTETHKGKIRKFFRRGKNLSDRGSFFDTLDGRIPGQTAGESMENQGPKASRGFFVMFFSPLKPSHAVFLPFFLKKTCKKLGFVLP